MSEYIAVLVDVKEFKKLPEEFLPYVDIKASTEGREPKEGEKIAIFNISTTSSYAVIFLDEGKTIEQIKAEIENDAGAKMNHESAQALKNALH
ncbi:DUF749 domain-containing protein [archaeon]|nr:DUF749 domain-containing protein [archaeon]